MARGATSRRNRRARREAAGIGRQIVDAASAGGAGALIAAATGSTSLPLSDRDTAWDSGAARKSLSAAQFPKAFFWHDAAKPADQVSSYKLGFASAAGGSLTAIWRGVTAVAGVLSGARGGVDIPDADVAGVKSRVEKYYAAARKKYGDDQIAVPWADGANAAEALAYAEAGDTDEYETRLEVWQTVFAVADAAGEFSAGADEFQHTTRCQCGHALSEHLGEGPCTHEDRRGTCSCGSFSESYAAAGMVVHEPRCWCRHTIRDHVGHDGPCTSDGCGCNYFMQMVTASGANEIRRNLRSLVAATSPSPLSTYDWSRGGPATHAFYSAAIGGSLTSYSADSWPIEHAVELEPVGTLLFRGDGEYVSLTGDGRVIHVELSRSYIHVYVAASAYDDAQDSLSTFRSMYPPWSPPPVVRENNTIPIAFWTYGAMGPSRRSRVIGYAPWADIEGNYPSEIRDELGQMMTDFEPGVGGQLLLWQGPPGTGKTWAMRALVSEWRDWAEFHYITDPDAFFVTNPDYMIDVLLAETYAYIDEPSGKVVEGEDPEAKWRVLILEDTGELLAANAKDKQGQGLSRLLNVVDGMVGQGLKILVLMTTNDELGDLNPAAQRPGRCAVRMSFGPFSAEEASGWLGEDVAEGGTLAELYALKAGGAAAFQMDGECANCSHMADQHADGTGPCEMASCDCQAFEAMPEDIPDVPAAAVTAAGDPAVWGGVDDLIDALEVQLPDVGIGESAFCVEDVAVSMDRALVRRGGDFWVAPFALGAEPTLAPQDEWHSVEGAGDDEAVALRRAVTISGDSKQGVALLLAERERLADVALPAEHQPGETLPVPNPSPAVPEPVASSGEKQWRAVLAPEGTPTDDGRMFAPGSITWRELPLSLMAMLETQDGHDGARVAGRIDRIWREGSLLMGEGVFDDSDFGDEVARMVADGVLRGLSVDLAIKDYDVVSAESVAAGDPQEADPADAMFGGDVVYLVKEAVLGMATVCPFPAFAEANISLVAAANGMPDGCTFTHQSGMVVVDRPAVESLTASAAGIAPECPPAAWFADPELEGPTALVVESDGRVYGHLASWGTCHIGLPGCTTPPASESGYSYFNLGEVECDDGSRVATGKITLGTGHADPHLGFRATIDHYDHTGSVVADVRAGEDDYGIWVAGAVRSDVDSAKVRELRAAPLSGDWRPIEGYLELVAALAVNVPGFPVPRAEALMRGDEVLSLVAAGAIDPGRPVIDRATRERLFALAASADGSLEDETLAEVVALARSPLPPLDEARETLSAEQNDEG